MNFELDLTKLNERDIKPVTPITFEEAVKLR